MYKVGETYTLTGNEPNWFTSSTTIADTYYDFTFPLSAACEHIDEDGDIYFRTANGVQVIVHSSANAETETGFDPVQKPEHYNTNLPEGIEVLDIIAAQVKSLQGLHAVCQANIIKYALRWQKKNGVEDLRKMVVYANRLIEEIENND